MATTKLTIKTNGSIKVEGDFEIVDNEDNTYQLDGRNIVALCRCGLSEKMPFCDGAHKGKFQHEAKAFPIPPKK